MVHPEVRNNVPHSDVGPAKRVAGVVDSAESDEKTNVAEDDILGVLVIVEGAARVEVVHAAEESVCLALAATLTLALVEVMASDVAEEVHRPAEKLLADEVDGCGNGGLLSELVKFVNELAQTGSLSLTGAGHKNHITLHVSSCLVVSTVGVLPAEVGNEKSRVEDPAGEVVDEVGVRECTVTTLVSEDPDTSAKEALHDGVDGPESCTHRSGGNVLGGHIVVENGEGG